MTTKAKSIAAADLAKLTSAAVKKVGGTGRLIRGPLIWGYVLAATYLVKLLPPYGGFTQAPVHVSNLWAWFVNTGQQRDAILETLCMLKPGGLWGLIAAVTALDAVLCASLIASMRALRRTSTTSKRSSERPCSN